MAAPLATIRPQRGLQETFLSTSADIAIAGGSAGSGKTWSLLLEPVRHIMNPGFGGVIFRRESPQITNQGGLWDESQQLYACLGATPMRSVLEWRFPSGARMNFAHLEYDKDRLAWDGSQVPYIGFDQLEHFLASQFWYMLSRNRSVCGVRPYIRATCNPVPEDDRVGGWLTKLIAWWIDQETGYPIWPRSGVIRWFVRVNDAIVWGDSAEEFAARFPDVPDTDLRPKSLTFIPGTLDDNPALLRANPEYRANLLALPLVERERLLGGNWKIRPFSGMFDRTWFRIVASLPADIPMARCRFWDCAGTPDKPGADPDWSVGAKMARDGGVYYLSEIIRVRKSAGELNKLIVQTAVLDGPGVVIREEQEPGSSGAAVIEMRKNALAGFNYRGIKADKAKVLRWQPMFGQAEVGNVKLVSDAPAEKKWIAEFLDEVTAAPYGAHDDQLDAVAGAFTCLALENQASLAAAAMYPLFY